MAVPISLVFKTFCFTFLIFLQDLCELRKLRRISAENLIQKQSESNINHERKYKKINVYIIIRNEPAYPKIQRSKPKTKETLRRHLSLLFFFGFWSFWSFFNILVKNFWRKAIKRNRRNTRHKKQ